MPNMVPVFGNREKGGSVTGGMNRIGFVLLAGLIMSGSAWGQHYWRKHNFTVGGGGGIPRGELRTLETSPVFRVGYGYRFHPNFQADVGLDTVFHAANVRDFFESQVGDLRIKDYQYMLPMGGRAIIPLGRVMLYGGGGGVWLRYQESIRQPFGESFRIDCRVCRSRSGWGYYGLLGASVALDRYQNFRLGFSSRVVQGDTSGDSFGPLPAFRTADRWINTALEFTFSF